MKKIHLLSVMVMIVIFAQAQTQSPAEFLGYELGERFTPHHKVVAYFEHVATSNDNIILQHYGKTNELRPLLVAFVSSKENIVNLQTIREDNLRRAGIMEGNPTTHIPITWLSYNVHGNEAVSSEAAMMTIFSLVDPKETTNKTWLENNLVVMDPCLNPDGQERYVNWYNQKANTLLQPDPQSVEHQEPWPGGRPNHYLFDLNRDWAWQTQIESQQRMALYNRWLPQLHLDFHEQGINDPYYFAPAAEPLHFQLTEFQHEFQELFGRNTANYFDEKDWFYFTKERFDLLYPSYGDTYPMYHGAIGMTIEQGGSGRAGLGILTSEGDTLTLKDRIIHHHTTALSAIEITSKHATRVVEEFEKYFSESSRNPKGDYKSFIIKGSNSKTQIQKFINLLDKNGIQYGISGKIANIDGFNFATGKSERFTLAENDIVINAFQPKSVITQVLFEPEPELNDSITYDITSWALPYAFNLEAYAVEARVDAEEPFSLQLFSVNQPDPQVMAYIAPWQGTIHAAFLSALMQDNIRIRFAEYDFEIGGSTYPAGSLIITRGGNQYIPNFHQKVTEHANNLGVTLGKSSTGYVDRGKDFGSPNVKALKAPKVALIGGMGTSSLNFGEIWHFFEQDLAYPLSILEKDYLKTANLAKYDVIILPSGNYSSWEDGGKTKLIDWVKAGGKLIAIENALEIFSDKEDFLLSTYLDEEEKKNMEKRIPLSSKVSEITVPFLEKERWAISENAAGAIFQVKMDETHPLGYGTKGIFYTLKNNPKRYSYLKKGVNAGTIPSVDNHRTGFIGYKIKPKMGKSLVFGVETYGQGQLVYMVDNPIFRGFWESGKLILANAVFMVGQ